MYYVRALCADLSDKRYTFKKSVNKLDARPTARFTDFPHSLYIYGLIYIRSRGRRNLNGRRGRPTYLKGVSGNVPTFETAFVLVCHYAISKLCKGMCHHRSSPWGQTRVPTSPHSPVSTMGTSAAAGSVLPHQRLRQPDSALQALLLAIRLDLRQARFRASRRDMN